MAFPASNAYAHGPQVPEVLAHMECKKEVKRAQQQRTGYKATQSSSLPRKTAFLGPWHLRYVLRELHDVTSQRGWGWYHSLESRLCLV